MKHFGSFAPLQADRQCFRIRRNNKNMRHSFFLLAAVISAGVAFSAPAQSEGNQVLRMVSMFPTARPQIGDSVRNIVKSTNEISGGSLRFELYEPGKLLPRKKTFEAVSSGEVEAAFSSPLLERKLEPSLELFGSIPFGPRPNALIAWMQAGGGSELMDEIYQKHGIKAVLCGIMTPQVFGWFPRQIESLKDLQGLRMRFVGLGAQVLERNGVKVKRLPGSKIVSGFKAGELDAAELATPLIDYRTGLHKWAKYYYFPGWHQPATLFNVLINLEVWRSLSSQQRAQIKSVCMANLVFGIVDSDTRQTDVLEKLRSEGIQIQTLPNGVVSGLRRTWLNLSADLSAKDPIFAKVWASLTDFLKQDARWRDLAYRDYGVPERAF
ncbi:MAG: TRAP transporter substrate-binding protein [Methyloligellaceae bacterium]